MDLTNASAIVTGGAGGFGTVDAVAEGCDALVATGVRPAGVWR